MSSLMRAYILCDFFYGVDCWLLYVTCASFVLPLSEECVIFGTVYNFLHDERSLLFISYMEELHRFQYVSSIKENLELRGVVTGEDDIILENKIKNFCIDRNKATHRLYQSSYFFIQNRSQFSQTLHIVFGD